MLTGECCHNIDTKGRMMVPSRFRDDLGEKFVLTKGIDNCIFIYPLKNWTKLEAELIKLPLREADIKRRFLGGKEEVEIDKQGRILIPVHLRSHAKLQKECVSIGVGDRVEIWDKSAWELKSAEFTSSSDILLDRLDTLGI